jgi:hypothetical protein
MESINCYSKVLLIDNPNCKYLNAIRFLVNKYLLVNPSNILGKELPLSKLGSIIFIKKSELILIYTPSQKCNFIDMFQGIVLNFLKKILTFGWRSTQQLNILKNVSF